MMVIEVWPWVKRETNPNATGGGVYIDSCDFVLKGW